MTNNKKKRSNCIFTSLTNNNFCIVDVLSQFTNNVVFNSVLTITFQSVFRLKIY